MLDNPILITGVYRSGTTMLTGFLDTHENLEIDHPSVQYFRYIIKKNISPNHYKDIVHSIAERVNFRYQIKLNTSRILSEIENNPEGEVSHKIIYDCVMRGRNNYSGKRWGEKTLLEWTNIPTFIDMYPSGKTIHIVRDPRDVLASYKNMTYETKDKYLDAIFNCLDSMTHGIKYSSTLSKSDYYLVKFEDIINNKMEELEKICRYLDIEFNEANYDQDNVKEGVGSGTVNLTVKSQSSFPSSKSKSFKRWHTSLSSDELNLAEGLLSNVMKHFDYKLSDNFNDNHLDWLLSIFKDNELINKRFIHYLQTGEGAEEFPSDATNPKNWASATADQGKELNKVAANMYKKLFKDS